MTEKLRNDRCAARNKLIIEERAAGATLLSIAKRYGITKERVRQIVGVHAQRMKRLAAMAKYEQGKEKLVLAHVRRKFGSA